MRFRIGRPQRQGAPKTLGRLGGFSTFAKTVSKIVVSLHELGRMLDCATIAVQGGAAIARLTQGETEIEMISADARIDRQGGAESVDRGRDLATT